MNIYGFICIGLFQLYISKPFRYLTSKWHNSLFLERIAFRRIPHRLVFSILLKYYEAEEVRSMYKVVIYDPFRKTPRFQELWRQTSWILLHLLCVYRIGILQTNNEKLFIRISIPCSSSPPRQIYGRNLT